MLSLFTPVAIVCDHSMNDDASALRGILESFRLRVDFYHFLKHLLMLVRHWFMSLTCSTF